MLQALNRFAHTLCQVPKNSNLKNSVKKITFTLLSLVLAWRRPRLRLLYRLSHGSWINVFLDSTINAVKTPVRVT